MIILKKSYFFLTTTITFLLFAACTATDDSKSYNQQQIAVIDYQLVTDRSREAQDFFNTIEKLRKQIVKKLSIREKYFIKTYKELQNKKISINSKQWKTLYDQSKNLEIKKNNIKLKLDKFVDKWRQRWKQKFNFVIKNIAQNKSYLMILHKNKCLFVDINIDITDLVIKTLNESYDQSQKISIPQNITSMLNDLK